LFAQRALACSFGQFHFSHFHHLWAGFYFARPKKVLKPEFLDSKAPDWDIFLRLLGLILLHLFSKRCEMGHCGREVQPAGASISNLSASCLEPLDDLRAATFRFTIYELRLVASL
jgi:hypothetical protein